MKALDRTMLALVIDHTLLTPEATSTDIVALCAEADELSVGAVCVSPNWVSLAHKITNIPVASVVGFPSGSHLPGIKASEAAQAVSDGATEIDMVANLGWIASGEWSSVEDEVAAVRQAIGDSVVLKVILVTTLTLAVHTSLVLHIYTQRYYKLLEPMFVVLIFASAKVKLCFSLRYMVSASCMSTHVKAVRMGSVIVESS